MLAVENCLERADCVGQTHVLARQTRELLGNRKRLAQEVSDLAGTSNCQLILIGQLINTQNGDDVLKLFVALQDLLDAPRDIVMLLPDHRRVENTRCRNQRVHGREDADGGQRPLQIGSRIKERKGRCRSRVGRVIGGDIHGLDRRDRTVLGAGNPLLQTAHLRRQRRLVADRAGHPAQKRRNFGAGLDEPKDVINKQQHILALFVPEVFGHC